MLASTLDGSAIPGVDLACNALYLTLVGEMPEAQCPPGCTLQATAQGTIYVLDHIRRIGYPLQLTPVAAPHVSPPPAPVVYAEPPPPSPPPQQQPVVAPLDAHLLRSEMPHIPVHSYAGPPESTSDEPHSTAHKRSRASSVDSRSPSSSTHRSRQRRRGSRESSLERLTPFKPQNMTATPHFCLIPPRPRWLEDIFYTLQISNLYQPRNFVLFYCHYCRVYFAAKATAMWQHLSQSRGHSVQKQRVRGYMTTGNRLLNTSEKRMYRIASVAEIRDVPARLFAETDRMQRSTTNTLTPVPPCIELRSLLTNEQREKVARDGAADAAKVITRDDLTGRKHVALADESPQLVGWRFLMEGLDIVTCHCNKKNIRVFENNIYTHHNKKD